MKRILLLILFLPLLSFGRKFYISSSTGNDAYTYLQAQNPSTPWKTLSHLEDMANTTPNSTFAAGDTIAFKRGDVFANGRNRAFGSFIWSGPGTPGWGGNCPSGTLTNPIVFTSYGIGPEANILFPYPSSVTANVRKAMLFDNVGYIVFDSLQFNDTRFSYTDKVTSAYTCSGLELGEGFTGDNPLSVHHMTVKNCIFSNISYGIVSIGRYITIQNNSFTNFKASGDTIGINDVGADAIMPTGSHYLIKNNLIQGSWAYANPNSSSEGKLGGGLESINDFDSSLIIYNTFFDNSGAMEFGQNAGTQYGPNDDTFAFNKFINNFNACWVNVVGPFACTAARLHFWNNVIIENQNSRHSGPNFGQDVLGDGQSFTNWSFWPSYPLNASNNAAGRYFGYSGDQYVTADTLYDVRNNIIWNNNNQAINYSGRTKIKYNNNLYRLTSGSTIGAALGPGEISTLSKIFVDTTSINPMNWDFNLMAGSPAISNGTYVGVSPDYGGNTVTNPPSMGIYNYNITPPTPTVNTLRVRKRFVNKN